MTVRLAIVLVFWLFSMAEAQRWPIDAEAKLLTGRVVSLEPMSEKIEGWDGSNDYHLLTLADGTKAVFRSEDEPWGSQAEVAAYRLDQHLCTELVPPTFVRTLRRDELPRQWPWSGETRPGSLQFFVEGAKSAEEQDLKQPDWANSEILSFLMGRYDNHTGNLLVGPDGRLVVIDFEGSLDVQKVRYGEFPFLRRGGRHEGGVESTKPFPFDNPSRLVNPTLEEIRTAFGPWWAQYWPQGMEVLFGLLGGLPDRTIPYVVWDERLWVQVPVRSRHPAYTRVYPPNTIKALRNLKEVTIRELFGPPYGQAQIEAFEDRLGQLLVASQK